MRMLKPGDPCPFCGMPILMEDSDKLFFLSILADLMEHSESGEDGADHVSKSDTKN